MPGMEFMRLKLPLLPPDWTVGRGLEAAKTQLIRLMKLHFRISTIRRDLTRVKIKVIDEGHTKNSPVLVDLNVQIDDISTEMNELIREIKEQKQIINQLKFRIETLKQGGTNANVIEGGRQSVASEVVPLPENPTFRQLHYHLRSR